MANLKGCYSNNTDDWKTPSDIYNFFMSNGYVDCFEYQSKTNELANYYFDNKLFINPPYSKMDIITPWIIKMLDLNNKIALLIPARTDTKYFHRLTCGNDVGIVFIIGRLHFNDSKSAAPFPSILLLFNYGINGYFVSIERDNLLSLLNDLERQ